jgi:hypothetical protein
VGGAYVLPLQTRLAGQFTHVTVCDAISTTHGIIVPGTRQRALATFT